MGENHIHSTILPSGISSRKLATALFCTQTGIFRQKHHIIPSHFRYSCIVGYAGSKLQQGATVVAPQFSSVGKNGKFNLQDFTGFGDNASWGIYLDLIDPHGIIINSYVWVEDGGENGDKKCWLDGSTFDMPEKSVCFEPGQAFWVEAQNSTQKIQSAGEVPVNDATVQLCKGVTLAGNFTPTKMALQDLYTEGNDASWAVYLDIVESHGIITKSYIWVEDYGAKGDQKCWIDGDTFEMPEEGVFFNPGQAFWIETQIENLSVTFPGVEL